MRLVIVESPYAARLPDGRWDWDGVQKNKEYLRAAMHDCLVYYDEAPYASHALYTQPGVLDDREPWQRKLGMKAGFEWNKVAKGTVVYVDRGLSQGMKDGIKDAIHMGRPIDVRSLDVWNEGGLTLQTMKEVEEFIKATTYEVAG